RHAAAGIAGPIRQADRRGNGEMGQGDPGGQHQGGMKRRVMKLPRRNFLHLAAGAAAISAASRIARAQAYPTRPIHWIVSFAAGGPNDTVARLIRQFLSEKLGQQIIVENRVGAGGNIGMGAVLGSPPDGYTLGFVAPNNAINATLYEKASFRLPP